MFLFLFFTFKYAKENISLHVTKKNPNNTKAEKEEKIKCNGLEIQADKGNTLIEIFPNNMGLDCNSFYT